MENRQQQPRILGVTLARGGSKSIREKNIRIICGVPLIAYTVVEAKRSQLLTRYILSTDNEKIRETAKEYGADAPFLRPAYLASDTATSVDALQHAVQWIEQQEGKQYDYIVELMATNPMKTAADIDAVITKLIETGADSVIGMSPLEDHHPARIKKIVDDRIVDFCVPEKPESRRQDLRPRAYIRNGSIYALKRNTLMTDNRRYGTRESRPYVMDMEASVNIDTPVDLLVCEWLLKKKPRPYLKAISKTNAS